MIKFSGHVRAKQIPLGKTEDNWRLFCLCEHAL